jgi:hypothetical protein
VPDTEESFEMVENFEEGGRYVGVRSKNCSLNLGVPSMKKLNP